MKKQTSQNKGFTLIEVVLAIAVGLIIIAGVSVGYSYAKKAAILDNQRKDAASATNTQTPKNNLATSSSSNITPTPTPKPTPKPNPLPVPVLVLSSGIQGKIVLGPTCPVQSTTPDPRCDPKPYQATVIVKTADGTKEIKRFTSASDGKFKVTLSPGTYLLVPVDNGQLPRGETQKVVVNSNSFTQVNITFDTGIR